MVGMKLREKEEVVQTTEKSKTFGAVSAITTEAKHDDEQVESGVTGNQEKTTSLELGDLMAKLEQTVKKTEVQRRRSTNAEKTDTIQQKRESGQLLQPGKGNRRKVTTDVRKSGSYRQRA